MTITIRPARPDELPAVLDFWSEAAENDARPPDSAAAVRALLARDPHALLVAVDGERLLGTVIAGWDGWRAHLYRLAVSPSARRQGIGRQLLARAESHLAALGAIRLDAMVLDDNGPGRSIWAASGYTRQEEWSRWVKPVAP